MHKMARIYAQNRIRELRKSRRLSMEALGLAMPSQLTPSTIAKLETGQMALSLDYINEIANVLRVSPADIVVQNSVGVRVIPVINHISTSAWKDALCDASDHVPVPASIVGENLFALRPVGDSMDLVVEDGGFVVVDPDQRQLIDGKMYAIMNGQNQTTFKRFHADPPRLEAASSNPNYDQLILGEHPFVVIGRIVYAGVTL